MKNIFILILLAILMTSCYDETIVDPNKVASKLTIKVFDEYNQPQKNAIIKIISGFNSSSPIINDSTDLSGEYSAILLEGNYFAEILIHKDNVIFSSKKSFQVVGGVNRVFEFKPFENIGDISIILINSEHKSTSGVNVALLTTKFSEKYLSFDEYYKYAYLTGISDTQGKIKFSNVPLYYEFSLLIYRNNTSYQYKDVAISVVIDDKHYVHSVWFN